MDPLSLVSVILPVRNEAKYIGQCLDSIISQTISKNKIEVLVIDGISTDKTTEIVRDYMQHHQFIRLLHNPEQNTIAALNIGIKRAVGDIIIRVDGHTYLEKDYIENCVAELESAEADNVGGAMRPIGTDYIQKTAAFATTSMFGIGPGKFHYSDKVEYVDTVYLGAFKKKVFERVGLFDPDMPLSEDNELNLRIIKSGGKILLSPRIKSYYYPRKSIRELWSQYFKYGYYKVKVLRKHKLDFLIRHLIPSIFVSSLVVSATLTVFKSVFVYLFSGILSSYLFASIFISLNISLRTGIRYFPALIVVFATLHFGYGIGFLKGFFDFIILKKSKL